MDDSDVVLIGAVASAVLQAVKRIIPVDLYPVVLIVAGATLGAVIGYGRAGASAVLDGAIKGIGGAFAAAGVYSATKAVAAAPPSQPRDRRGRFLPRDDADPYAAEPRAPVASTRPLSDAELAAVSRERG